MNRGSLRPRGGVTLRPAPIGSARAAGWPVAVRRLLIGALPYVATASLVVVLGLPTLILPFWADSAIFATIGREISNGGFPYVDAWDQKPPSIYFIFAIAIHGPLGVMRNVRAFDLAWTALTVIVLIELGRRWWSLRAGVTAGLLYGVVYVTSSGWLELAQPDGFIALPLALALLLQEVGRGRKVFLIAAGLCLGFAFQLRFIMAALIPLYPYVECCAAPHGQRLRLWLRTMLWLGVGFVLFQAALAAYLQAGDAVGEYFAATRFAAGYTRLGGPWQGPEGPTLGGYLQTVRVSFLFWALTRLVLTAPAIIAGLYGALIVKDRRVQQLVLFLLLIYVGIAAQAKFFWYHFQFMLPFLALLSGWGWDRLWARLRAAYTRPAALAITGLLAVGLLLGTPDVTDNGFNHWKSFVRWHTRPHERDIFLGYFKGFLDSRNTAYYLQRRTQPTDPLYIWGYDPLIYLLADRPSASRFIYAFPLMSDWAPRSWQAQFMEEMHARPPVYFVAQRYEGAPWITGHAIDPVDYIPWFPALEQWLEANYELETELTPYVIYRRK